MHVRRLTPLLALWVALPVASAQNFEHDLRPAALEGWREAGQAVDIDGDWVVVSARLDDEAAANAGAAWILERHAGQWSVDEKLVPQGSGPGALFTHARVAIEYPWAFAGSLWEQAPDGSGDRGVVRVYRHDPGTDQWQLTQSLWLEGAGASSSFG